MLLTGIFFEPNRFRNDNNTEERRNRNVKISILLGVNRFNFFFRFQAKRIHLFLAVKMGAAICKFYGSGFRSHPHPAIFSSTKQFVLLFDMENWCVLSYYFYVLS